MKTVYTYGVYDLLHVGHIQSLKEAKKLSGEGGKLIVGVFTDKAAESFKRKPIMNEIERLNTVYELGIADEVVYQTEKYPGNNIEKYDPDIIAKGPGAGFEDMSISQPRPEKVLLDYHPGVSTTDIIKRIRGENKNIILSNNLIGKIHIRKDDIIRVNLAWVKDKSEAMGILDKLYGINEIYLDYPSGRTKPPETKITGVEALELCNFFKPKYFAISNAEDPAGVMAIRERMPIETELVPKIETKKGVRNFNWIIESAKTNVAMLDKEDLYTNNKGEYEMLLEEVREKAKMAGVHLLELVGVIFN